MNQHRYGKRLERKRNWRKAVMIAGIILAGCFIYQTCRLYKEKNASAEEAAQWRMEQTGAVSADARDRIVYQGRGYRRNTYVKAILCLGIDRKGPLDESMVPGSGGQADGIFLVAQDTARNRVSILVIPRDTMTEITLTDLSGNVLGQGIQHLTLGYAYGDGREKSCRYMTEAVSSLLGGLGIDGYMAVSMSALPLMNDGVGGVTVVMDEDGLEKANPDFTPGKIITLDGKQAEAFIRYRDINQPQSALTRTERQKTYIQGFLKAARIKAGRDEGFVPRLLKDLEPYMITDMAKDQYMDMALAFLGSGQDLAGADMLTLPGEAVETSIYDEYHPDKEQVQTIILDMFYRLEE